jgi:hydrogenase maturation factor
MNLVYGEILNVETENGMQIGTVNISGARKKVPLELVSNTQRGDTILMCDGVAIAKVEKTQSTETPDKRSDSFGFRHSSFVI